MTFLDVVRALADESHRRCDPECSMFLHRRETAEFLLLIREHPEILEAIKRW